MLLRHFVREGVLDAVRHQEGHRYLLRSLYHDPPQVCWETSAQAMLVEEAGMVSLAIERSLSAQLSGGERLSIQNSPRVGQAAASPTVATMAAQSPSASLLGHAHAWPAYQACTHTSYRQ